MSNPYITPSLFSFFRDLKKNNDRDWFNANKSRYLESVRDPLLQLITDFGPLLSSISPHFLAIPKANGGSLFRIYRDVRFSKNKDPYKTHAGVHFRHEAGKNAHAPGFYLHIELGAAFIALGLWQPEMSVLTNIRRTIADDPDLWTEIISEKDFSDTYNLEGSSLKRPPKGFDAEHPLIDEIKRKDFIAVSRISKDEAMAPDFLVNLAETWGRGRRFAEFLTLASGHPF